MDNLRELYKEYRRLLRANEEKLKKADNPYMASYFQGRMDAWATAADMIRLLDPSVVSADEEDVEGTGLEPEEVQEEGKGDNDKLSKSQYEGVRRY